MCYLALLVTVVLFYAPVLNFGQRLLRHLVVQDLRIPLVWWPIPAWLTYSAVLLGFYLALAVFLCGLDLAILSGGRTSRLAHRLSSASLGAIGWLVAVCSALALFLGLAGFPLVNVATRAPSFVSTDVTTLAALVLLAEALRLYENSIWEDRAYAAGRRAWLEAQGYLR